MIPIPLHALAFALLFPCALAGQSILDDYVRQGLESHESIRIQEVHLEKSLSALREAKGLFLPAVHLMGTYTLASGGRAIALPVGDLLNPVYATLNQLTQSENFPQIPNVEEQFNPNNFYDLKTRTTLPLIHAEIWRNRQIREGLITVESAKLAVLKRELERDIRTAYFGYLQAEEAVAIYRKAQTLAAENVRLTDVLVHNGMASPGAQVRAGGELSRVGGLIADAENQARNAAAYVNFLLNRDLSSPVLADSAYFRLPANPWVPAGPARRREELDQLDAAREAQDKALRLARAYAVPRLSAFADFGSQGFDFQVGKGATYVLAGLSLDLPLYAGGRNREKIRQNELDLQTHDLQTRQVADQLALQLQVAENNLEAALAMEAAAAAQASAAQRYRQDMARRYREQQVLFIELLEAESAATQALLQASINRFQVWVRLAERDRAL